MFCATTLGTSNHWATTGPDLTGVIGAGTLARGSMPNGQSSWKTHLDIDPRDSLLESLGSAALTRRQPHGPTGWMVEGPMAQRKNPFTRHRFRMRSC